MSRDVALTIWHTTGPAGRRQRRNWRPAAQVGRGCRARPLFVARPRSISRPFAAAAAPDTLPVAGERRRRLQTKSPARSFQGHSSGRCGALVAQAARRKQSAPLQPRRMRPVGQTQSAVRKLGRREVRRRSPGEAESGNNNNRRRAGRRRWPAAKGVASVFVSVCVCVRAPLDAPRRGPAPNKKRARPPDAGQVPPRTSPTWPASSRPPARSLAHSNCPSNSSTTRLALAHWPRRPSVYFFPRSGRREINQVAPKGLGGPRAPRASVSPGV